MLWVYYRVFLAVESLSTNDETMHSAISSLQLLVCICQTYQPKNLRKKFIFLSINQLNSVFSSFLSTLQAKSYKQKTRVLIEVKQQINNAQNHVWCGQSDSDFFFAVATFPTSNSNIIALKKQYNCEKAEWTWINHSELISSLAKIWQINKKKTTHSTQQKQCQSSFWIVGNVCSSSFLSLPFKAFLCVIKY